MIAWAWWVGIFSTNTNCKAVSFRDEWSVAEVGCGTELVATVAEAVMLQQQQQQQHSFSRDITLLRSLAQGPTARSSVARAPRRGRGAGSEGCGRGAV